MAEARRCPECGVEVRPDAGGGLCPNCAARLASGEPRQTGARPASPDPDAAKSTVPPPETVVNPATDRPGGRIGRYRLLHQIGEGGWGVVYLAEQETPVKRQVALKVVKPGMDTKEVLARFEAERQALALMEHPNIAKVLDAGATDSGRPFFVMELVRGIRITDYCDQNQISTEGRLRLFVQVCQAVQHAHQKGIIHRDLKPSNILIALQDGVPVPKVIDFGIAKATAGQALTDKTLVTAAEEFIGTPAYMSPEQAEMSVLDIDTRSDIYALGVVLYELLTSRTPFDAKELLRAGLSEMRRIIREEEPPRPSTRINSLDGNERTAMARRRGSEPPGLIHQLRGDLDWIVMKCLEKDRTRRYETASGLARDIGRHLEDKPVEARPPSVGYRAGKYVRRHKLAVVSGAVLALAVIIGSAGTVINLWRAVRAEKKAVQEAETAKQVSDFLVDLFNVSDPGEARGNSVTAREILDKGAAKIDRELQSQPRVRARLLETIGTVYTSLGLYQQARSMLEKTLELKKHLEGTNSLSVADTFHNLGVILDDQGKYDEAASLFRQSLDIRTRKLGSDHPEVARSLNSLAIVYWNLGRNSDAEPLFEKALAIKQKHLGSDHPDLANTYINLGVLKHSQLKFAEAEVCFKRALAIWEKKLGADHPDLGTVLNNLAALYEVQGRRAEAEPLYLRCYAIWEKALGPDHPDVAIALHNLANLYRNLGRYAEAEPRYLRSLAIWEKALGSEHRSVGTSLREHANLYREQGRYADADPLYLRALRIFEKDPESNRLEIGATLENYALLLRKMNRTEGALKIENRLKALQNESEKSTPTASEGPAKK
ncbi:MAG TPA: serine/threonine-protein kinase [Verrucomicrobiae bacterium]